MRKDDRVRLWPLPVEHPWFEDPGSADNLARYQGGVAVLAADIFAQSPPSSTTAGVLHPASRLSGAKQ
jgi:hypothetical protein